ncbi:MAG: protein translocase subunit SecD [Verrucomicrobia bacterium]|nr:protein translocase subunit SecD [Verrucomicrobiota bacterium]
MKQNLLWKFLFVSLVVVWSIYEMSPPTARNLVGEFEHRAAGVLDTNFTAIVGRAHALEQQLPGNSYSNLVAAIGTNPIAGYFPKFAPPTDPNPTRTILNKLQRDAAGRIHLGLDLQGGQSFLVELDTTKLSSGAQLDQSIAQAIEVLRKRVDKMGVAEPVLQPAGGNRILIQLPGLSESAKQDARITLQKAAFLEFRMVHPNNDELIAQSVEREPLYERLFEETKAANGEKVQRPIFVKKKAELTGKYLKRAMPTTDMTTGEPEILFEMNSEGASLMGALTREHIRERMAIVLDGVVYSAPVIQSEISASGRITGSFDIKEAIQLAQVMENPLEAPVKIIEERGVDPSLGADSIKSGMMASLIGTAAVALFMLVYYLRAGVVANVALLLNLLILIGVMCALPSTFTLPGIAGIVLTIGMAVDANVLIYERIREELAAGKSIRGALAAGYDKAFGTIFDSNLTTLISSVLLIFLGTGSVKGFGVTLTIGLCVSMFTALFVTRLIFDWLLGRGWLNSLSMLQFIKGSHIDFMKVAKPAFAATWLLIIVGCTYGGMRAYKGDLFGVDFVGGDAVTFGFEKRVGVDKVRESVQSLGFGDPTIQYQRNIGNNSEFLAVTTAFEKGSNVIAKLQQDFPEARLKPLGQDRVGPVVGREIQRSAVLASLLSLFGILIYVAFRYEFSFAVGAVLAIIHDLLMTFGIFSLAGLELSSPIVAAFLTIIGFSTNDTIVIFDRIREDLKLGVRGSFKDVLNTALNQTLSRTLITSGTVFLSTMALYVFGGGAIKDFAFTFLVGIVTGTYSSIYIASALVLWWHKGQRPTSSFGGSQVVMQERAKDAARV